MWVWLGVGVAGYLALMCVVVLVLRGAKARNASERAADAADPDVPWSPTREPAQAPATDPNAETAPDPSPQTDASNPPATEANPSQPLIGPRTTAEPRPRAPEQPRETEHHRTPNADPTSHGHADRG